MASEENSPALLRPNAVPGVVTLFIVAHALLAGGVAAYFYSGVRAMGETIGFSLRASLGVLAVTATLVMLIAFIAGLGVVGVPVLLAGRRAADRSRRGCCLGCGYSLAGGAVTVCPECATDPSVAPEPAISARHMPALAVAALLGILGGAAAAEWAIVRDERAFAIEAAAWEQRGGTGLYARARAWPNTHCGLVYVPGQGISAHD
jgi:hypothetical protein